MLHHTNSINFIPPSFNWEENYFSAILFLFFNQKVGYDEDESTAAYHSYEFLLYVFPIVGAIVADSLLGRYRTMAIMSIVIAIGSFITAVGVIDALNLPIKWTIMENMPHSHDEKSSFISEHLVLSVLSYLLLEMDVL